MGDRIPERIETDRLTLQVSSTDAVDTHRYTITREQYERATTEAHA
ncbi:MAG: hypothetical protein ABEH80_10425 [Halobaculum sp.]